ncbi:hypothetical protein [Actinomadura geliboluensis]|uniref:Uncharacterized protein n=1 Tax=Actinomadura geliboluensis TaxID=882440 RepID=A0A5S4GMY6_9ACTN|nr:hypothetical protein [Actinomadura geliboluensis]TMR33941.1 hypothetical protein ETD96_26200 [Actinomadura geliboluensis]
MTSRTLTTPATVIRHLRCVPLRRIHCPIGAVESGFGGHGEAGDEFLAARPAARGQDWESFVAQIAELGRVQAGHVMVVIGGRVLVDGPLLPRGRSGDPSGGLSVARDPQGVFAQTVAVLLTGLHLSFSACRVN